MSSLRKTNPATHVNLQMVYSHLKSLFQLISFHAKYQPDTYILDSIWGLEILGFNFYIKVQTEEDLIFPISGFIHPQVMEIYINWGKENSESLFMSLFLTQADFFLQIFVSECSGDVQVVNLLMKIVFFLFSDILTSLLGDKSCCIWNAKRYGY